MDDGTFGRLIEGGTPKYFDTFNEAMDAPIPLNYMRDAHVEEIELTV
jgi:hypothetical protein